MDYLLAIKAVEGAWPDPKKIFFFKLKGNFSDTLAPLLFNVECDVCFTIYFLVIGFQQRMSSLEIDFKISKFLETPFQIH